MSRGSKTPQQILMTPRVYNYVAGMTIHRGWSKYAPNKSKMTDGRHFGKLLNCHIYATIRWILMKFGMVTHTGHPGTMMQMGLLTVLTIKRCEFQKFKMANSRRFENH